jgi:hypothetical protein
MLKYKNGPEYYRQLAAKCRETAITVSAEKERADLLAMAQIWDLIASRVGHAPRRGSAVNRSRSPSFSLMTSPLPSAI